jgi:hypothetical protein
MFTEEINLLVSFINFYLQLLAKICNDGIFAVDQGLEKMISPVLIGGSPRTHFFKDLVGRDFFVFKQFCEAGSMLVLATRRGWL